MSEHLKLFIAVLVGIVADRFLLNRLIALISGLLHPAQKATA